MAAIKVIPYARQRENYLAERHKHNLFLSDTWAKMAEGTEYNSIERERAAEYGKIAQFYRDAIDALKEREGESQ